MQHLVLIFVASLLAVAGRVAAEYQLVDNFEGEKFFDGFTFFDQPDPTRGNVNYVSASRANSTSLAGYVHDKIYLGVDRQSGALPSRDSTRVSSKNKYNKGLFVADFEHMPVGCSVWPAYWTLGAGSWPYRGEIDILEGVNSNHLNHVTLHTGPGCTLTNRGLGAAGTTTVKETNCAKDDGHVGCGQKVVDPKAYGPGFNANGGGVYAMEWTSKSIKTWFFPRGSKLAETLSNSTATPDIASFGVPITVHGGSGCDIDTHFVDHQIIFDTTLCGDWAGADPVWAKDKTCRKKAPTCKQYIASAGKEEWDQAYWLINYVRVYQQSGGGGKPLAREVQGVPFTA